jgi:hypothetical protein
MARGVSIEQNSALSTSTLFPQFPLIGLAQMCGFHIIFLAIFYTFFAAQIIAKIATF